MSLTSAELLNLVRETYEQTKAELALLRDTSTKTQRELKDVVNELGRKTTELQRKLDMLSLQPDCNVQVENGTFFKLNYQYQSFRSIHVSHRLSSM